jgi:hypothetical protein
MLYYVFHVFQVKPFYPITKILAEIVSCDYLVYEAYQVNYYKQSSMSLF